MKSISVNESECTGCRICEVVCSFIHNKNFNPRRSRISVFRDDKRGLNVIKVCKQCDEPYCVEACPNRAIYRNKKSKIVSVNENKCEGCGTCVDSCPFNGIFLDILTGKSIKCTLCDDQPRCIDFCPRGAIEYVQV